MSKKNWFCVCGLMLLAGQVLAAGAPELKSDKDKLSYSIGASIGKNLKSEGVDVDLDVLIEGIKGSFAGEKGLLAEKDIRQMMNDFQTQARQRAASKRQQALLDNKKKGEAYLAQYKAQPGVLE